MAPARADWRALRVNVAREEELEELTDDGYGQRVVVHNITFEYNDGTASSHGWSGGTEMKPFVLREGHELVQVTCREGDDALDSVKFDTQGDLSDCHDTDVSMTYGNQRASAESSQGFVFHEISADGLDGDGPKTAILDLVTITTTVADRLGLTDQLADISAVLDCKGQTTHARKDSSWEDCSFDDY